MRPAVDGMPSLPVNWLRKPSGMWQLSAPLCPRHRGASRSSIEWKERSSNSRAKHWRWLKSPTSIETWKRRSREAKEVVHPVNGEVPPVKGRPWKLPHYANRGKTSSSRGELASARSCFSTVRTALGKLRITGLLARFDVARSFPQFPRPLLLQPTIWTSERGADLGSGRCQPRPHLPIYRMTQRSAEVEAELNALKEKMSRQKAGSQLNRK